MTRTLPIATITVTFNPNKATLARQLEATQECAVRIIVDNGSNNEFIASIKKHANENTHLIELKKNKGIAAAQNIAIRHIERLAISTSHILFLDHDTVPLSNSIATLFSISQRLESKGIKLGAVGPQLKNPHNGLVYGFQVSRLGLPFRKKTNTLTQHLTGINSAGSLIPTKSLEQIGGFDEDLFIDHVDTEWALRAQAKDYELFGCGQAVMEHDMGDDTCNYWLFGQKKTPYRSPARHYYIFRNSALLYKKKHVPSSWITLNVIKLTLTFIFFGAIASCDNKAQRKMMINGLKDGIRRKTGKSTRDT